MPFMPIPMGPHMPIWLPIIPPMPPIPPMGPPMPGPFGLKDVIDVAALLEFEFPMSGLKDAIAVLFCCGPEGLKDVEDTALPPFELPISDLKDVFAPLPC